MARLAVSNAYASGTMNAITTTLQTLLTARCAATNMRRFRVVEFSYGLMGSYSSTDSPVEFDLTPVGATAAGTAGGTQPTIQGLDPADTIFGLAVNANFTVEPTVYTANVNLHNIPINQRGSFRWFARDDLAQIVAAATASSGIGWRAKSITSGYTGNAVVSAILDE
jgi:hypothetical protein